MLHAPQDLTSFISAAGGKLTAAPDSDDDTVEPTAGSAVAGVASNPVPHVLIGTNDSTFDPRPSGINIPPTIGPLSGGIEPHAPNVTDTLIFAHGTDWQSDPVMCDVDQNGPLPKVQWFIKDPTLHTHQKGGDLSQYLSHLDCF